MLRSALALGLALAAVAAPCAAASSIVYVKGGDVWRAAPNGARKHVVVRAAGISFFSAVTQDDRGRLWAVREPARRWERYSTAGRRLGKPFNTAGTGLTLHYDPARNLPGFAGTFGATKPCTKYFDAGGYGERIDVVELLEDSPAVWTARFAVPAQTGQACVVTGKRLLARKATSPDWGPAAE
jgi:hypothetical protein